MMKAGSRFSFSVASATFLFLCFAPGAFGQGAVNKGAARDSFVLSSTLPALLALAPNAGSPQFDRDNKAGCDSHDRDRRSKCTTVPEGGTAFAYLSLVALGCLATGIFRIRRQARLSETK